jgi:hypothetical protein
LLRVGKEWRHGMAHNLTEPVRKEIFLARVEAQDREIPVAESRREMARRFAISDDVLAPENARV